MFFSYLLETCGALQEKLKGVVHHLRAQINVKIHLLYLLQAFETSTYYLLWQRDSESVFLSSSRKYNICKPF